MLKRIGFIMVVVSIVLFAVSVYFLSSGTTDYTASSLPGKTAVLSKKGVQTGDDLTYRISVNQYIPMEVKLVSPSGSTFSDLNYTTLPTGKVGITVPDAGTWSVHVMNNGNYMVNATTSLDNIQHTANISAHGSVVYSLQSLQVQSTVTYSVSTSFAPAVHVALVSPTGTEHSSINLSDSTTGSATIVAPSAGTWELHVTNNGSLPVNLTASIGDVSYAALGLTIFGVALLPGGIALISIYVYSVRMEKKRNRLKGLSQ